MRRSKDNINQDRNITANGIVGNFNSDTQQFHQYQQTNNHLSSQVNKHKKRTNAYVLPMEIQLPRGR